MPNFHGSYLPTITPFTAGNEVDVAGIHANVDWWINEGTHGLIPGGSAGEFLQLSDDEYRLMVAETVEAAAGRVPVIVGITSDSTADALSKAQFAEEVGADGTMLAPPYYSQVDASELEAHFRDVAQGSALPMMVYNNPFTTGVELTPQFLAELGKSEDNVKYVKDTSYNVQRVIEINDLSGGEIKVFAGLLGYESIVVGAVGWVSIPGLVVPALSAALAEAALSGDLQRAAKLHAAVFPLMKIEEDTGKFVQIPKAALNLMNRAAGSPRAPRRDLAGAELTRLREILAQVQATQGTLVGTS
ncbi:4-hydroxy-tetrahydrodipicolinate synthase [Mycolicibacterium murale]|uniref:4-hydroxy-tetrahydrodipicolinate synthase n=1 Tax=Mycolicibacterium murale TaxID=182220 RepID=A0A7I9WN74_9MYCO|nr:dihydrodipicolinate synthase family protein [Mycolicibacterium murale]MCV7180415.1 dihydrodipicolinate synthase family protein [Mycolicibacterium murale]GFG58716.1 4-hydroxy-tetrahydrodipicolinate synthase [Mycolicibacterium murale]